MLVWRLFSRLRSIEEIKKLINGEIPSSIRLTRAHKTVLNRVLVSRIANQFDYGVFQAPEEVESEVEIDDDDIIILMNDFIPSPIYHREFYVTTPETSDSDWSNELFTNETSDRNQNANFAWGDFDQFCSDILEQK